MGILSTILLFVAMFIILLGLYAACKKYIFPKIRINKWIPLAIAIVLFVLQIFMGTMNQYASMGLSIFAVLFFLWFMDLQQNGQPKKKGKQIVIKPKAKPNRVKNKNKHK